MADRGGDFDRRLREQLRVRFVIYLAFLFSLFAYALVGGYLRPSQLLPGPFRFIFYLMALGALASNPLWRMRLKAGLMRDVMGWVLCDLVGILGLILYLLMGNILELYAFIALALLAMLYYRPSGDIFNQVLK